jgi:hypothetical protein
MGGPCWWMGGGARRTAPTPPPPKTHTSHKHAHTLKTRAHHTHAPVAAWQLATEVSQHLLSQPRCHSGADGRLQPHGSALVLLVKGAHMQLRRACVLVVWGMCGEFGRA